MISIAQSKSTTPNERFAELPRLRREDNVAWIRRAAESAPPGVTVLLLGGRNRTAFRLRVAQSHARHDLTPSHWSHVGLLKRLPGEDAGAALVHEVTLERGFRSFPPQTNGLQTALLRTYRSARWYPNVAAIQVPATWDRVDPILETFGAQRHVLDCLELLIAWAAFTWGVGKAPNPLLQGAGIPGAAMVEYVLGAVGIDPTPGLASRSSCPEAIWQGARWWQAWFEEARREPLAGAWVVGHRL